MSTNQSIISVMSPKDIFVTGKKGVSEGFRRLSIICGIFAVIFSFDWATEMLARLTKMDPASLVVWLALAIIANIVTFFVVAIMVRLFGWVAEGFSK